MKVVTMKLSAALMGAVLLSGCAGVRAHRGAVIDNDLATAIQVGVDNKDSVAKSLGRPTFVGKFDQNEWFYVGRDTRAFAFRNPRVVDQTTLVVRFDAAGNVASIRRTGEELVAAIDPMDARTPTLGRQRSFFEELFGNIGTVGGIGAPGGSAPPSQ